MPSRRRYRNPASPPSVVRELFEDYATRGRLTWEVGGTKADPHGSYRLEINEEYPARSKFEWADSAGNGHTRLEVISPSEMVVDDDALREMGMARLMMLQQMAEQILGIYAERRSDR